MKKKKWAPRLLAIWTAGCLAYFAGCGQTEDLAVWQENETDIQVETQTQEQADADAGENCTGLADALSDNSLSENSMSKTNENAADTAASDGETSGQADGTAQIRRPKVKGIYVTGAMAGTANMDNLIDLADRTEINTLVIDVKNDEGRIVYEMDAPLVNQIGAVKRYVKDMPALIQKCKEKDIYLIARIVAFKDPFLAEAKPEWSLHNADGSIFRDKDGLAWVNPYEKQVWDYLVELSLAAVETGFDEIQYDYIRFSTDRGMKQVDFGPAAADKSKEDVIAEFTEYASDKIHAAGAAVSADVYGVVIDSAIDQEIVGQDYLRMAESLDALSPMVYPSHYGPYNYDIPIPDAQPYDTVLAAMQASRKVLAGMLPGTTDSVSGNDAVQGTTEDISGNGSAAALSGEAIAALAPLPQVRATVRPWLQDFTASWVKGHIPYGPQQIRDQIQAVYDAGYEEWILWNAANRYTEGGLLAEEEGQ